MYILNSLNLIILFFCFLQQDKDFYSFKEEFSYENTSALTVNADNGNINISSHQSDKLIIKFKVYEGNKFLNISKEEFFKEYSNIKSFKIERFGNEIKISTEVLGQNELVKPEESISIHFEILVPQNTSISLFTYDGFIKASNLKGFQSYFSYDGDLHLSNLGGQIVAKSLDGNLFKKNVYGQFKYELPDGISIEKFK